jgi:hypothetical protein
VNSKWFIGFWAMLLAGVTLLSRTGPTPTAFAVILAVGVIAFFIAYAIESIRGKSKSTDDQPAAEKDVRPPDASTTPTDSIASGYPPPSTPVPAGAISAEPMNVPPILLDAPKPAPPAPPIPGKKDEPKDTFRELIETVVFVVVLVLMLKTFLAEAFVIPTGSMADTLLGYHHKVTCEQCGKMNLVNASSEADPQGHEPQLVKKWRCENCGWPNHR